MACRGGSGVGCDAQVTFEAAAWCDRAAGDLAPAADQPDMLEIWQEGVENGRLQLWAILADGARIGSLVWCAESEHGGGRALVVQGAGARPCGVNLVACIDAAFAGIAKAMGGATLRFWTIREGMARRAARIGYARRYVMEREIL